MKKWDQIIYHHRQFVLTHCDTSIQILSLFEIFHKIMKYIFFLDTMIIDRKLNIIPHI